MKKTILFLFLFFFTFHIYADDLRISMGNSSGSSQNVYVRIEDKGTAEGGARYDKDSRSITNTSDGTSISVANVDFGSGRYGLYSHILIEYSCNETVSDAFFDIYLGNTTTPIASIPVVKTNPGEFREGISTMSVNVVDIRRIYIRWRGHSASIKTFGGNELKPAAEVKVVRTGSPLTYKYSYGDLKDIEGVHNVKMVWENQNANVHAVYFTKSEGGTSIDAPGNVPDNQYKIFQNVEGLCVESHSSIGNIAVYSLTGKQIAGAYIPAQSWSLSLKAGIYLLKIVNASGEVYTKKIMIK